MFEYYFQFFSRSLPGQINHCDILIPGGLFDLVTDIAIPVPVSRKTEQSIDQMPIFRVHFLADRHQGVTLQPGGDLQNFLIGRLEADAPEIVEIVGSLFPAADLGFSDPRFGNEASVEKAVDL